MIYLLCNVATQVALSSIIPLVFKENSFLGIVFQVEEALAYKHLRLQSAELTALCSCQLLLCFAVN